MNGRRIVPRSPILARLLTEPYELLVSTGVAAYGVVVLATRQVPISLARVAPHAAVLVWAALLTVAALGVAVGMFRSKRLELAANVMLGGLVLAYAATVVYELGVPGIAGAAFAGPIGAAALVTARRIVIADRVHQVIERDAD